jgi:hypothetical protein
MESSGMSAEDGHRVALLHRDGTELSTSVAGSSCDQKEKCFGRVCRENTTHDDWLFTGDSFRNT